MRILFVSPAYPPPFPGGGERFVGALANEMHTAGHQIAVATTLAQRERDFWAGRSDASTSDRQAADASQGVMRCTLRPFPGGRVGLLLWRKLMVIASSLPGNHARCLQSMAHRVPSIRDLTPAVEGFLPADLIHGFNLSWEYPALVGREVARRYGIPYVITPFMHFGTGASDRVARNTTMDHQIELLRTSDAVLVLTDLERDGLAKLGVPQQRITIIGAGVDPIPNRLPSLDDLRGTFQLPDRFFIFVGRNSYDKGAIHAAEGVLSMSRHAPHRHLVLVGQTTPEFDRFLKRLGPTDRGLIHPLGIVSETDKHALIRASDALVLPSRTDSFGIAILEAWVHGRPVVGAKAGGIPAVIDEGRNGLLVPFGDVQALSEAMMRLLANPTLATTLGEEGRKQTANSYTWQQVGCRALGVYQSLVHPSTDTGQPAV